MKAKVGIIGKGHVGSALGHGLARAGYEVRSVGRDAKAVRETADWAEVIVVAVPYPAVDAAVSELGSGADGKTVVDTTNPLTDKLELTLGFTNSAGEELQRKLPRARVAKAFNTVFAACMESGRAKGEPLTVFAASDHEHAKTQALGLARDIGFDAVDAGPLRNARWLEAMAYQVIQLGLPLGMGTLIGIKLVH